MSIAHLNRYHTLDDIRAVCIVDTTFGCWVANPARTAISSTSKRPIALDRNGKIVTLYKLADELAHGPNTDANLTLDHRCRDRWCVRPLHLERVNRTEQEHRKMHRYRMRITKCPRSHVLDEHTRLLSHRGGVLCRACVREDKEAFAP